ncbi:hypothetical protein ARMGADRAFT_1039209 [Armillaria gallica]|uniref:Uncharacterized protein n=1 Tax=Armillaria gallica TaxID=47427 RepID=A0A2H3CID5_ARMGA|nr:hypothetical protein ARMGADRAFT_1039209 [Armillaria gallica]
MPFIKLWNKFRNGKYHKKGQPVVKLFPQFGALQAYLLASDYVIAGLATMPTDAEMVTVIMTIKSGGLKGITIGGLEFTVYFYKISMQALQLQNQALSQELHKLKVSSTPLPSSDSASGQVAEKPVKKNTTGLEGLLLPAEIKDMQSKARAFVVTCNIWWDRFDPFRHPRVESAKKLVCYHKELKELNKKVGLERQISILRVVEALYDVIPEQFHDMAESGYPKFVKTLMQTQMTDAATGLQSTLMLNLKRMPLRSSMSSQFPSKPFSVGLSEVAMTSAYLS